HAVRISRRAAARMPLEVQVWAAAVPRAADASHIRAAVDAITDVYPARAEVRVPPLGAAEISELDADAPPASGRRVDHGCRKDRAHRLACVRIDVVALMRATRARGSEVVHHDVRSDDRADHAVPAAARRAREIPRQYRQQERLELGQLREL